MASAFNTIPEPFGIDRGKLLLDDADQAKAEPRLAALHRSPEDVRQIRPKPISKILLPAMTWETAIEAQSQRPSSGIWIFRVPTRHGQLLAKS